MSEFLAYLIPRFATAVAGIYADKGGFQSDINKLRSLAVAAQLETEEDSSWSSALLDALERGGGRLSPEDYKKLFFVAVSDPRNEALQLLQYEQCYIPRYRRAEVLLEEICGDVQNNYERTAAMMFSGGPFEALHVKKYMDSNSQRSEGLIKQIVASALYLSTELLTEENVSPLVDSCI